MQGSPAEEECARVWYYAHNPVCKHNAACVFVLFVYLGFFAVTVFQKQADLRWARRVQHWPGWFREILDCSEWRKFRAICIHWGLFKGQIHDYSVARTSLNSCAWYGIQMEVLTGWPHPVIRREHGPISETGVHSVMWSASGRELSPVEITVREAQRKSPSPPPMGFKGETGGPPPCCQRSACIHADGRKGAEGPGPIPPYFSPIQLKLRGLWGTWNTRHVNKHQSSFIRGFSKTSTNSQI